MTKGGPMLEASVPTSFGGTVHAIKHHRDTEIPAEGGGTCRVAHSYCGLDVPHTSAPRPFTPGAPDACGSCTRSLPADVKAKAVIEARAAKDAVA